MPCPSRRSATRRATLLAGLCISVSGCGDGSGPEPTIGVSITAPEDGDLYVEGARVTLTAGVDASSGVDSVIWNSSLDGRIDRGSSIDVYDLSLGVHEISVVAFSSNARDEAAVTIRIDSRPDVTIVQPAAGTFFLPQAIVTLSAEATDRDGGDVTVAWESSIDGALGDGSHIEVSGLSFGDHSIRAVARDDEGRAEFATTTLNVADHALAFDGVQDGASTPLTDFDFTGEWTIEFWIRPFDASRPEQHLVSQWGVHSFNQAFSISIDDRRSLFLRLRYGDGGEGTGRFDVFTDDEWTHVAITFGNTRLRFYVNGITELAGNATAPRATDSPLSLGRSLREDGSSTEHFHGLMDEVRIWNVVRSQQQIAQNRGRRLSGSEAGLVAMWRMEAGDGGTVADASGGGHTLRLGNADAADAADPEWHFPGVVVR